MAVPKRKTTPSKRKMRRSHDFLVGYNIIVCSNCGEPKLSHQICLSCGYYNKKEILKIDDSSEDEVEE
tara:strand:+ start:1473 stop:1676 length:204 start_codon:yes stop_codon:yes gene_type:complete